VPVYIQGDVRSRQMNFGDENFEKLYRPHYPDNLDLSPDGELHRNLLLEIFSRVQEARGKMEERFDSWRSIDRTMRAYKDLSVEESDIQAKDENKPVSIVVPLSFALREAAMTYYVSRFYQPPIFRYRGIEGNDPLTAAKMEVLVDLQRYRSKVELSLYSLWSDQWTYGVGFGAPGWMRQYGIGSAKDPIGEPRMLWEGNKLTHINPYDALPDPNKGINDIQSSEYFGRVRHTSYYELLSEERTNPRMFNCRYLKYLNHLSVFKSMDDEAQRQPGDTFAGMPVDVIELTIVLIPKDWKLGDSEYPEKWLVWVAGDGLIIRLEPLGLFYDEHPVVGCAALFDDYTMTPQSMSERLSGMQLFADWLINAYILGTRRGLGLNIVVDPYAINMADLRSDEVVKYIRLNKSHWGRGKVSDYIHQLKIDNVTSENIPGVSFIMDMMQRVAGLPDSMQGIMRGGGERRSATEAQNTFDIAVSRMLKSAKIISIQTHQDIARMFAYNNQQYLSNDLRLKITGDLDSKLRMEFGIDDQTLGSDFTISKDELADFDYNLVSYDATSPGDQDRTGWRELVTPMLANPQAGQMLGLDMQRIFLHVARTLGEPNAANFLLRPPKARTLSDRDIEREEQRGNITPIETTRDQFGLA